MLGLIVIAILATIVCSGAIGYSAGKEDGFYQGFNNAARQWTNKYNIDMYNKHQEWNQYVSTIKRKKQ